MAVLSDPTCFVFRFATPELLLSILEVFALGELLRNIS
jgi:hypothetical protein